VYKSQAAAEMLGRASVPGEQVVPFVAILFPPSGASPIHRFAINAPLARQTDWGAQVSSASTRLSIHITDGRTQLTKLPKVRTNSMQTQEDYPKWVIEPVCQSVYSDFSVCSRAVRPNASMTYDGRFEDGCKSGVLVICKSKSW
jgi:hypothetical protein